MADKITWNNEKRKLSELIPWPRNPRQINREQAKRLGESFEQFGQVETIAIGPDNEVYNGHQRINVLADKFGGDYEVEVRVASRALTEKEREKLTVFLHKGAAGEWDFDVLANEFELDDLLDWGFDEKDLDLDLWAPEPVEDVEPQIDKAEELREKWGVELGQLWQLGSHRLICGDCTDKAVVERVMGGENIKTIFTSPPYNMAGNMYKYYSDDLKSNEYIKFNINVVNNLIPFLRGFLFWNISYNKNARWEFMEIMYKFIEECHLRFLELIIWDKCHGIPITSDDMLTRTYEDILLASDEETYQDIDFIELLGTEKRAGFIKSKQKGITNYWKINPSKIQMDSHSAIFPIELPERAIKLTTNSLEIVMDPFLGSGTTLIACERLGRKCRAVELSPAYCAVAIQRWVDVTGGTPELIG
jgi:DNA modification methylase